MQDSNKWGFSGSCLFDGKFALRAIAYISTNKALIAWHYIQGLNVHFAYPA